MKIYTHIVGSILFFVFVAYLMNLNGIVIGIFIAGWISVLPDVIDRVEGKHKGIGHSIIWLIPFIIIGNINFLVGSALIIGFSSHIFFDIFTWNGCPFLYPFSKMDFVSLSRRNRIKTGTNQEKAIFVFIIFLLIPLLLFTTGIFSNLKVPGDQNSIFSTGEASGVPLNNYHDTKNPLKTINLNLQLNSNMSKNITIHQANENDTNIVVK